jgi:hypothetical protein
VKLDAKNIIIVLKEFKKILVYRVFLSFFMLKFFRFVLWFAGLLWSFVSLKFIYFLFTSVSLGSDA